MEEKEFEESLEQFYKKGKIFLLFGLTSFLLYIIPHIFFSFGRVPTESMEPTIKKESRVVALNQKFASNPTRDSIILFRKGKKRYVKRVVGLPGDTVSFQNTSLYINGKVKDEPYIKEMMSANETKNYHVPKETYFVLGDNRNNSIDSRFWKNSYVKKEEIIGTVKFIF